jgi:hypothetical protein
MLKSTDRLLAQKASSEIPKKIAAAFLIMSLHAAERSILKGRVCSPARPTSIRHRRGAPEPTNRSQWTCHAALRESNVDGRPLVQRTSIIRC